MPLIEHYTVDIDALLTRIANLGILNSRTNSPNCAASLDAHTLFKRVRGRQIELASPELLMQLMDEVCSTNDPSSTQTADSAAIVIHHLKQAASRYNASAAQHLSEDLKAASESICSSMCAFHRDGLILVKPSMSLQVPSLC